MASVCPSSNGYVQQDNAPCHKAHAISSWFSHRDDVFSELQWPQPSPDLSPIEHLWHVVKREIRRMNVMLSCQHGAESVGNVPSTLVNPCHEELDRSGGKGGSYSVLERCT